MTIGIRNIVQVFFRFKWYGRFGTGGLLPGISRAVSSTLKPSFETVVTLDIPLVYIDMMQIEVRESTYKLDVPRHISSSACDMSYIPSWFGY